MSAPIDARYREQMNALAAELDTKFNGRSLPGLPRRRTVGFVLLTMEFGKITGGRVNYISNGDRDDMIAAMKEFIARHEGRHVEQTGGAQ